MVQEDIKKEHQKLMLELSQLKMKLKALKNLIQVEFAARDKANNVAFASNNIRLDGMNEFRETLKDQAATFVSSTMLESKLDAIDDRIKQLEANSYRSGGRDSTIHSILPTLAIVISVVVGLITVVRLITGH